MLKGLTRLVRYFILPTDEVIDRRLRNRKLGRIREYCERQGFRFYPEELLRFPAFAGEVNRFIEDRARRDLPQEQFEDRLRTDDISKWVEVGGIIGYNRRLFEMCYCPPDTDNVEEFVRLPTSPDTFIPKRFWIELYGGNPVDASVLLSVTSMKIVPAEDLEKAKYIIDWHTHPVGFGELDAGDVYHMRCVFEKLGETQQIYFVVFRPAKNQCVWYQAKKVQPPH